MCFAYATNERACARTSPHPSTKSSSLSSSFSDASDEILVPHVEADGGDDATATFIFVRTVRRPRYAYVR